MKFVFLGWPAVPTDRQDVYQLPRVVRYARTVEEAVATVEFAPGTRLLTWMVEPEGACTMCGGPFHPSVGHWESETRHWCGVCTRGMVKLLKEMQPRRWGSVRFYDHALPPPAIDTSVEDLT